MNQKIQRKNILLISSAYKGGEKTHVSQLLSGLSDNYQLFLWGDKAFAYDTVLSAAYTLSIGSVFRLYRFVTHHQITLIHCHGARAALLGRLLALVWHRCPPILVHLHGYNFFYYPSKIRRYYRSFLERCLCKIPSYYIAGSHANYHQLIQKKYLSKNNLRHIPIGISQFEAQDDDRQRVINTLNPLGIDLNKHNIIMSASALEPVKGIDFLLDVASEIPGDMSVKWIVLGEGRLTSFLLEEIQRRGLHDRLFVIGQVPDIRPWLKIAALFVATSEWESGPYTILEAMSVEVPVVSRDVPGCCERVSHDKTGRLSPVNDPKKMAADILDLLEHPDQCTSFGKEAKKEVEKHYRVTKMLEQTQTYYEDILKTAAK